MADKSAKLSVDVVANTRQAQSELDGFSSKVAGMAAGVAASVTSFAIDKVAQGATWAAGELVDAVDNAATLNAALRTTQQVYGDAAEQVAAWAGAAAKNLGLSKVQALGAARGFSTFGKMVGKTGPELAGFSEGLVGVAADLGAFADLPTAQAVEAIGAALRGERDPLEKFGVILNDATVKAAYFAATGVEVTGVLTAQENVIGTIAAITGQAADKTGQYARESGELAAQQQETAATWENMSAALGAKLLPAVQAFSTWVNDSLLPALSALGTWWDTSTLAAKIRDVASALADRLQAAADDLVTWWYQPGGGKETFDSFLAAVEGLEPKVRDLWNSLKDLKNAADAALGSFGGLSGVMQAQFGMSLLTLYGIVNGFITAWNYVLTGLKQSIALWMAVWQQVQKLAEWLGSVVELAEDFIGLGGAGGLLSGIGGLLSARSAGGAAPAGYGTFGARSAAPTYVLNANVNVPAGVFAGDVGAAVVAALDEWAARNGALPARVTGMPARA